MMATQAIDLGAALEIGKSASVALSVIGSYLWSERKRKRGSREHEAREQERSHAREEREQERYDAITKEIRDHRSAVEAELVEMGVKITTLSTVVGVDNNNGLRGSLKDIREDVKQMQRDALLRADRRLNPEDGGL